VEVPAQWIEARGTGRLEEGAVCGLKPSGAFGSSIQETWAAVPGVNMRDGSINRMRQGKLERDPVACSKSSGRAAGMARLT